MENKFSERIAHALKDTGLSNDVLAQILGVNRNTVSSYKNCKGDLKGIVLVRLREHFGYNPEWLLTGKGNMLQEATDSPSSSQIANHENVVEMAHCELIKEFKNKEAAKRVNELLVDLERISEEAFLNMINIIETTVNTVKIVQKTPKKRNRA